MPAGHDAAMLGPLWALVGTLVALLLGATFVYGRNWRAAGTVTILGALATAVFSLRGFSQAVGGPWAGFAPAGSAPMLIADQFSYFFTFLIAIFLALVVGLWVLGHGAAPERQPGHKKDATEFFVLFVGSAFGMALMVSTTNLLMILLAVEMASLPSYAIAGFRKRHRTAAEASVKYVLFGAVTSAIMVYGASLLYGQYQTLDLTEIGHGMATQAALTGPTALMGVSLFALLIGVAFKVSAVPFHFWCPDVFEGASIEITTWLSVASKAAGLGLMLRIMTAVSAGFSSAPALEGSFYWVSLAIGLMAAVTCTVGNLSAFWQTNLKRLLAFSSIAHAGYMLMAVAILWHPAAGRAGAAHPAFSVVAAYLVVYLFMNFGAFAVLAMVYWSTGKETLDAFNGLGRRNPALAIMMTICLFSLVGLPPFGGFIAKWYLLFALYDGGLVWLIFVAVFNTLISLYYYARIARAMYFAPDEGRERIRVPAAGGLAVAVCALVVLLTGTLWAGNLKEFSDARSRGLYSVGRQVSTPAPTDRAAATALTESTRQHAPNR